MVEVFKTDVTTCEDAQKLIGHIHQNFQGYLANFDLEDCDLILRVQCTNGMVNAPFIIELLKQHGFHAEILADDFQPITSPFAHFYLLNNKS